VLDTNFIILPLKTVLTCPDTHVLRRLSVLEVRYNRYRASRALARGDEFPVDTDFLLLASEHTVKAIAMQLSEDALREFHQLSTQSVLAKDDTLRRLGTIWDSLCRETEEVAAIQALSSQLESLVLIICNDSPQDSYRLLIRTLDPPQSAKFFLPLRCSDWAVFGGPATTLR
jgi:hypothetical protein